MQINTTWETLKEPIHYSLALKQMEDYVDNVINKQSPNKIWLLEHLDVYTGGTSAEDKDIISPNGIEVISTNRGGKFTYHGLGQRIIYPMINLNETKDIKLYVASLEKWVISTLNSLDVESFRKEGKIGIWTLENGIEKKIGAIGIRVKKWVAYHGISININPHLENFSGIVPCGISDFGVTSLQAIKKNVSFSDFDNALKNNFNKVFI